MLCVSVCVFALVAAEGVIADGALTMLYPPPLPPLSVDCVVSGESMVITCRRGVRMNTACLGDLENYTQPSLPLISIFSL